MTNVSEHINKYFAGRLTPENAALLLVDHQTGLSLGIETMTPETFNTDFHSLNYSHNYYLIFTTKSFM